MTNLDVRAPADPDSDAPAPGRGAVLLARLRRVDPVGPLLGVVAAVVYALPGFNGYLSRDLALYAYAGQQVADGVAPYVGVYNRVGPLAHITPGIGALAARLVGGDDLLGMRILSLLLSAAAIWMAYLLGRDLFRSRAAGIATGAALLGINGFALYATTGPREKTLLVLLLLTACWAVVRGRPGWAGFFIALATLTWQPGFFGAAPAALVALAILPRGRRLRGLAAFVLAGLAPLVAFLAFYAAIGHLHDFLECYVLINAQYTQQPGLESSFGATMTMLRDSYGASLWIIVVGAVSLLVAAALAARSAERRRDPQHLLFLAFGVGLLVGLAWCFKALNGFPDIFFLLPMTSIGIGYLVHRLGGVRAGARPVALVVAVAWFALTAAMTVQDRSSQDDRLVEQRAETAAAMRLLPADASVVSIEAPQVLVLAGRTDPFQHQMFSLGLEDYVDDTWPGGLEGLGRDIGAAHPTVITVGTIDPTWLDPVLQSEYVEVGTSPGWHWWVERSLGARRLEQLRSVLR